MAGVYVQLKQLQQETYWPLPLADCERPSLAQHRSSPNALSQNGLSQNGLSQNGYGQQYYHTRFITH